MSGWDFPPINEQNDLDRSKIRRSMRIAAWGIGIGGALLIIATKEGVGPGYVEAIGIAILWSGSIFLPLLGLNRDLLKLATARLIVFLLSVLQLMVMFFGLRHLSGIPIIAMFPICAVQVMIFEIPFLWLRKRLGQG